MNGQYRGGNETAAKPNAAPAVIQREEFGANQVELVTETASTAVAARERAAVEARYIMAMKRPRNVEIARQQLLKACSYPDFAEASWYSRPAGRKFNKMTGQWEEELAEGFSIRFAEEAARAFGNVFPEMCTVFESAEQRIVRVSVTDLESNLTYSTENVISKRVERKSLKKGQIAIAERLNSAGEKVYIVEATDDEVNQKQNALRSKAMRTDLLRLLPAWLKEECKQAVFATIEGRIQENPDKARRAMIDAFGKLGIQVADLEAYFGKPVDRVTPPDLVAARAIYNAIKDGEYTWDDVMADRKQKTDEPQGSAAAAQKVAEEKLEEIRKQNGNASNPVEKPGTETPANEAQNSKRGFAFGGKKS